MSTFWEEPRSAADGVAVSGGARRPIVNKERSAKKITLIKEYILRPEELKGKWPADENFRRAWLRRTSTRRRFTI